SSSVDPHPPRRRLPSALKCRHESQTQSDCQLRTAASCPVPKSQSHTREAPPLASFLPSGLNRRQSIPSVAFRARTSFPVPASQTRMSPWVSPPARRLPSGLKHNRWRVFWPLKTRVSPPLWASQTRIVLTSRVARRSPTGL